MLLLSVFGILFSLSTSKAITMTEKENKGGVLKNEQVEQDLKVKGHTNEEETGHAGLQDTGDSTLRQIGTDVQRNEGLDPKDDGA